MVNTADGTATIAEETNSDNKVIVYSKDKTDALLNANADAIAKRKVTTDADGNIATITDGTTSVEVYTKKLANEVIGDRTGKTTSVTGDITALQTTVGKAAQGDNPATGLVKNVATNKADIHAINEHLGVRKATRADGRTRPSVKVGDSEALEAVVSLHATGANDPAGDQAEITISNSEVAITRGDGEVVFDADNDAAGGSYTRIRGGTATTIQTLRDQDIGVAPGTGNSGVLFQTTMYGLGGDYSVEYTADAAAFTAFTADGTLPDDAPIGATGIVDEGGTYKYVTNVRLGGVAAGVNANDAVNKGQLDAANVARTNADAALGRRIDTNSQRIDGNTQGIANVAAMASLPALPNGASSGFSAGIGGYNGKSAVAIGFQHRLSANTTFKVSAATGNKGKPTVGAGFSYSWGGSRYSASSQTEAMQAKEEAMQTKAEAAQAKDEAAQAKAALASVMERLEALEAKGAM
ncbi:YadA C-terminal domain-containing protein [Comamonadaceae bacterium M7527]|nr:YadA C-terminal domain-containing protein [Comamonadaceae bacterium M7527]